MAERPPLRVVNGQSQSNPSGIDYKSIAITVALTTAVSVAVTMMVQHIAGRVRRSREDQNPVQQQGFLPPFVPGQMPVQGQVVIPAGASYFPPPRTEVSTPSNLPPSLRVPREGRRREHVAPSPPANDVAPQWFAAFAKAQEQRFAQMEQRIAESFDDEDYDDDEDATG